MGYVLQFWKIAHKRIYYYVRTSAHLLALTVFGQSMFPGYLSDFHSVHVHCQNRWEVCFWDAVSYHHFTSAHDLSVGHRPEQKCENQWVISNKFLWTESSGGGHPQQPTTNPSAAGGISRSLGADWAPGAFQGQHQCSRWGRGHLLALGPHEADCRHRKGYLTHAGVGRNIWLVVIYC